jgi:lon-related putative ATP-dependent protease
MAFASLRVDPASLRRRLDPAALPFETTADVEPLATLVGQPRVADAIAFGVEMDGFGYNLFLAGTPGSGRAETIREQLQRFAPSRPPADDWVYVHDFDQPQRPHAIRLPPGRARELASDMDELIVAVRRLVGTAFESEGYEDRRRQALVEVGRRRDAVLADMRRFAGEHGFALDATPNGLVAIPVLGDRPMTPEEIRLLTPERQADLERNGEQVQEAVAAGLRRLHQLDREAADQVRRVDREMATYAIDPLLQSLREKYRTLPDVLAQLDRVRQDIVDNVRDLRPQPPSTVAPVQPWQDGGGEDRTNRYRVNVLVSDGNAGGAGAPVVFEPNPTYYNLVGRVEYRGVFGTMVTDYRQVRAGALHRANGGFLVLDIADVLRSPLAWDALKRALRARELRIESLGEQLSAIPTTSLAPEPIPLDVKVVLIGTTAVFNALQALDDDFGELFKVRVDFAPDMEWNDEHVHSYGAFISRRVRDGRLRHFDRGAVARVVEHGARLRDHQRKLSTRLLEIGDLVTEASFWAGKAGRDLVTAADVDEAVARRDGRSNLVEERMQELITDRTIRIETDGRRTGQVNGLEVVELGDFRFGLPARVTARVSMGRGTVESIEREIDLSGPIHSKGFLILTGYLAGQYGQEWPLALRATLTFEQSYGGVDGDSASSTELYALLSALADLPLDQGIAVTGSVDQHGEVQAVGGVTDKIEGFFRVCSTRGLTGRQGVAMPAANVPHLMLSDEVVRAVEEGRFHVWALRTIDEGIELLTGVPAGERDADGAYPPGSVHRRAQDRLRQYGERLTALGQADGRRPASQAPSGVPEPSGR